MVRCLSNCNVKKDILNKCILCNDLLTQSQLNHVEMGHNGRSDGKRVPSDFELGGMVACAPPHHILHRFVLCLVKVHGFQFAATDGHIPGEYLAAPETVFSSRQSFTLRAETRLAGCFKLASKRIRSIHTACNGDLPCRAASSTLSLTSQS